MEVQAPATTPATTVWRAGLQQPSLPALKRGQGCGKCQLSGHQHQARGPSQDLRCPPYVQAHLQDCSWGFRDRILRKIQAKIPSACYF